MKACKTTLFYLFCIVPLFGLAIAHAELDMKGNGEVIEKMEGGAANWTTWRLEAKGCAEKAQSIFQQKIAAEVLARANLLKVIDGVRIKAERIVRDGRLKGQISSEEVEGFLRHSYVSEPRKNELGLLEVTAYVYLDKTGRSILLKPAYFTNTIAGDDSNKKAGDVVRARKEEIDLMNHTGLIIDAGGLQVKPAMLPRILSLEDNGEIYRPLTMNRDSIVENGFCGYAGSLEKAKSTIERVGDQPLVVNASKVAENGIDLFVSDEDARRILTAEKRNGILSRGKIMIVVNTHKKDRLQ